MIKKYKEFINEGIFDLLSGYSMVEVKEKLNNLTPYEKYEKIKDLNLKYTDIYTQDEIDNFIGLDKVLASNKYDWIDNYRLNRAAVKLNNLWGYIDENGKEITPIIYDFVDDFYNGFARVRLNNKWGYIDENGNEITPIKYDYLDIFINGKSEIKLNNIWGYIDENGKEHWN